MRSTSSSSSSGGIGGDGGSSTSSGGSGTGGAPCVPTDDGNPCTDDVCVAGVPAHPAAVNGSACSDGDARTRTDTCQAGACVGANHVMCNGGSTCVGGACAVCSGPLQLTEVKPVGPVANNDAIVVADMNGDGKPDLVVASTCSANAPPSPCCVSVQLGLGNGTFGPDQFHPVGLYPTSVAGAEFDGDGKLDFAVSSYDRGSPATPNVDVGWQRLDRSRRREPLERLRERAAQHLRPVAPRRRGLSSGMKGGPLGPKTGEEILSLREAVSQAQAQYFLTFDQQGNPMDRGYFLLGEITATLEYLLDDGIEDEKDAQLDKIDAAHAGDPESFDALAGALDDYAAFAEGHRKEMDGLGGFDAAHLDEARKVAAELRARPAVGAMVSEKSRAALSLRNKLMVLLVTRMSAVRAAARFVFRGQPEIVREVTSEYERRRRAAGRRAKEKKAEAPAAAESGGKVK